MNSGTSTRRRVAHVIWAVVSAGAVISTVAHLVDASAQGFSAWDWVVAVALVVLAVSVGCWIALRVAGRRRGVVDRPPVDLARLRATQERDGWVAAVRELRRQDPELSLLEATRMVDAL